jgi:uncharacterized membrane protein YphA (DoxX/SURF4 family)
MTASPAAAAAPAGLRSVLVPGSPLNRWLTTVARVALGLVLITAGWLKISNPDEAVKAVQAYRILPYSLTHAFGYGLPLLEILIGALLVLGLFTRVAAIAGGVLMVVFIAGIISVWVRGLSIDCGCFGGGGTIDPAGRASRYSAEIARDLLFLGLASWCAVFPRSRLSLDALLLGPATVDVPGPDTYDDDLTDDDRLTAPHDRTNQPAPTDQTAGAAGRTEETH